MGCDAGAKRHTLALRSRTESWSATWSTKSWTPSVKRTINWRGGIGPAGLDTSSEMGSARCLPLAFSLRVCIILRVVSKSEDNYIRAWSAGHVVSQCGQRQHQPQDRFRSAACSPYTCWSLQWQGRTHHHYPENLMSFRSPASRIWRKRWTS